jgi:hypothetical protein
MDERGFNDILILVFREEDGGGVEVGSGFFNDSV